MADDRRFKCQLCEWEGTDEAAANAHEHHHHDGPQTCWFDEGKLVPVHTLDSGIRLFARADVERFLAERAKTGPAQARAALAAARAKAAAK